MITDGYFKTMGIAIRRGRGFEPTDRLSAERLVVINEALAAKYFPGEDPIGRYLETFAGAGERIIGIAANVAENTLIDPPVPARYMLYEHVPVMLPATTFVVSGGSAEDVPRLLSAARAVIQRDGGSRVALERTLSMASVFDDAVGAPGTARDAAVAARRPRPAAWHDRRLRDDLAFRDAPCARVRHPAGARPAAWPRRVARARTRAAAGDDR
jgi:hypothetical protein